MGDFARQTSIETAGENHYRAELSPDWMTWGPLGGYVAAIALRAAGSATALERPATFACQYFRVAKFDAVELHVESRRRGKRSEALRVRMLQGGDEILEANVWAIAEENRGLEHNYTRAPNVPGPEDLPVPKTGRKEHGMAANFERREAEGPLVTDGVPREPVMRNWYRFRPTPTAEDRFADAARSLILLDLFSWPATWPAHPSKEPSPWIAPNLDLHVRFHGDSRPHEWLLCETRADLAADGLIGSNGSIWSPRGELLAASSCQLFCRPRPQQFR